MYHYYVRYSLYDKEKKIGEGSVEIAFPKKITHLENIREMERLIKSESSSEVSDVTIDFYQLLRKD